MVAFAGLCVQPTKPKKIQAGPRVKSNSINGIKWNQEEGHSVKEAPLKLEKEKDKIAEPNERESNRKAISERINTY